MYESQTLCAAQLPRAMRESKWTEMMFRSPDFQQTNLRKLEQETYDLLQRVFQPKHAPSGPALTRKTKSKPPRSSISRLQAPTQASEAKTTKKETKKKKEPHQCPRASVPCGSGLQMARTMKHTADDAPAALTSALRSTVNQQPSSPVQPNEREQHQTRERTTKMPVTSSPLGLFKGCVRRAPATTTSSGTGAPHSRGEDADARDRVLQELGWIDSSPVFKTTATRQVKQATPRLSHSPAPSLPKQHQPLAAQATWEHKDLAIQLDGTPSRQVAAPTGSSRPPVSSPVSYRTQDGAESLPEPPTLSIDTTGDEDEAAPASLALVVDNNSNNVYRQEILNALDSVALAQHHSEQSPQCSIQLVVDTDGLCVRDEVASPEPLEDSSYCVGVVESLDGCEAALKASFECTTSAEENASLAAVSSPHVSGTEEEAPFASVASTPDLCGVAVDAEERVSLDTVGDGSSLTPHEDRDMDASDSSHAELSVQDDPTLEANDTKLRAHDAHSPDCARNKSEDCNAELRATLPLLVVLTEGGDGDHQTRCSDSDEVALAIQDDKHSALECDSTARAEEQTEDNEIELLRYIAVTPVAKDASTTESLVQDTAVDVSTSGSAMTDDCGSVVSVSSVLSENKRHDDADGLHEPLRSVEIAAADERNGSDQAYEGDTSVAATSAALVDEETECAPSPSSRSHSDGAEQGQEASIHDAAATSEDALSFELSDIGDPTSPRVLSSRPDDGALGDESHRVERVVAQLCETAHNVVGSESQTSELEAHQRHEETDNASFVNSASDTSLLEHVLIRVKKHTIASVDDRLEQVEDRTSECADEATSGVLDFRHDQAEAELQKAQPLEALSPLDCTTRRLDDAMEMLQLPSTEDEKHEDAETVADDDPDRTDVACKYSESAESDSQDHLVETKCADRELEDADETRLELNEPLELAPASATRQEEDAQAQARSDGPDVTDNAQADEVATEIETTHDLVKQEALVHDEAQDTEKVSSCWVPMSDESMLNDAPAAEGVASELLLNSAVADKVDAQHTDAATTDVDAPETSTAPRDSSEPQDLSAAELPDANVDDRRNAAARTIQRQYRCSAQRRILTDELKFVLSQHHRQVRKQTRRAPKEVAELLGAAESPVSVHGLPSGELVAVPTEATEQVEPLANVDTSGDNSQEGRAADQVLQYIETPAPAAQDPETSRASLALPSHDPHALSESSDVSTDSGADVRSDTDTLGTYAGANSDDTVRNHSASQQDEALQQQQQHDHVVASELIEAYDQADIDVTRQLSVTTTETALRDNSPRASSLTAAGVVDEAPPNANSITASDTATDAWAPALSVAPLTEEVVTSDERIGAAADNAWTLIRESSSLLTALEFDGDDTGDERALPSSEDDAAATEGDAVGGSSDEVEQSEEHVAVEYVVAGASDASSSAYNETSLARARAASIALAALAFDDDEIDEQLEVESEAQTSWLSTTHEHDPCESSAAAADERAKSSCWERYLDAATSKSYYYNPSTQVSQWTAPDDATAQVIDRSSESEAGLAANDRALHVDESKSQQQQHDQPPRQRLSADHQASATDWEHYVDPQTSAVVFYDPQQGEYAIERPQIDEQAPVADSKTATTDDASRLAFGGATQDEHTSAISPSTEQWSLLRHHSQSAETRGEWQAFTDAVSGQLFYYNARTGESSWEPPAVFQPVHSSQPSECPWAMYIDDATGAPYYVNLESGETTWELPAVLASVSGAAESDHGPDDRSSVAVHEHAAASGDDEDEYVIRIDEQSLDALI